MPEGIFENFRFDGSKLTSLFYLVKQWRKVAMSLPLTSTPTSPNAHEQGHLPGFQPRLQKVESWSLASLTFHFQWAAVWRVPRDSYDYL